MMKKFTLIFILLVIAIMQGQAQNLALSKTATGSTENQAASFAVDGDAGTRWESASEDPQWISIDLGQSYSIGQVVLNWEGAFASEYEIQISDDNATWSTIYTETASDGGIDDISVTGTGRYIRMYGTVRATQWGYSLWEFEVYEAAAAGKDASLSDLTVDGASLPGFSNTIDNYQYGVAIGTTIIPTVEATTTDPNATTVITDATTLPGTTSVVVTSQDGTVSKTFIVNFIFTIPGGEAPVPTRDAANVISVYSDSYTSIYTDLNPGWGQATVFSEEQFNSNNTLKYANLNYQGLIYTTSDVSTMEYLHVDYFTGDATALSFYLIGNGENPFNVVTDGGGITTGEWVSLDIPLTHYTAPDLTIVNQFKTEGNGTVYLDNFYFWKTPPPASKDATLSDIAVDGETLADFAATKLSYTVELLYGTTTVPSVTVITTNANADAVVTDAAGIPGSTTIVVTSEDGTETETYTVNFEASIPAGAAPTPTQNAADVISVYCDEYTSIATNLNPGWGQATVFSEVQLNSNNTLKYAGLNYQGTEYATTDVSSMQYVHLDYWTNTSTALEFFLIAGGENAYDIDAELGITFGQWVSIDIPLSFYANAGRDLTAAFQFKTTGNGTVYIDNMYFWKEAQGSVATLSDLKVDGVTIADFSSSTTSYTYEVEEGTTTVPSVTATTFDANATVVVTNASSIPGAATVVVTAEDGTTTETYTVNFVEATTGIKELSDIEFSIYPNPAADFVQIDANSIIESVEVFDLTGKTSIVDTPHRISAKVNISSLSKGIYIVKVRIDGVVKTSKVFKQ